ETIPGIATVGPRGPLHRLKIARPTSICGSQIALLRGRVSTTAGNSGVAHAMSLASLFHRNRHRDAAFRLYETIVEQARQPLFFSRYGVPDTLDGRFELLAPHGFLVLNRLKAEHSQTAELAQALFDVMFSDLDRALREMGVGDL